MLGVDNGDDEENDADANEEDEDDDEDEVCRPFGEGSAGELHHKPPLALEELINNRMNTNKRWYTSHVLRPLVHTIRQTYFPLPSVLVVRFEDFNK